MFVPTEQRSAAAARSILGFVVAYALALVVVGAVDAASLAIRTGDDHRLRLSELVLLGAFSARLSPLVHLALLGGGAIYLALLSLVPLRLARTRIALLCLPIGLLASVTSRAATQLPLFMRVPLLESVTWVAGVLAPFAFVVLGLLLAKGALRYGALFRWIAGAVLTVMLALFMRVFGLTESVIARIPGTLLSLIGFTYLFGYLLGTPKRVAPQALTLVGLAALAGTFVALAPNARSTRVDAMIAHKTQLLQSLLFTEIAAFGRELQLPECKALPAPAAAPTATATVGGANDRDVLVLSLDALRADRLAAYGYDRVTMPQAEALMRESILFETAYSAAPGTAGSFTAAWTGSSAYTLRAAGRWPPTVMERLRARGYRVLGSDLSRAAFATAEGYPTAKLWDTSIDASVPAEQLVDQLIASIQQTPERFLAFAHFHETHDSHAYSYTPKVFGERPFSRYDDGMFEVDRQIGRLIAAIRASGRYDSMVIVFTSDHGEFFGEHARLYHGSLLYEPVMRVPLSIKVPRIAARRESTFASGFDLAPTVYRAAIDEPWPLPTLGGDLLSEIAAGRRDRVVFMENVSGQRGVRRLAAVRKGRFKYTQLRGTGIEELFDLERDPGELDNIAGEAPEQLRRMRTELAKKLEAQACELKALLSFHSLDGQNLSGRDALRSVHE